MPWTTRGLSTTSPFFMTAPMPQKAAYVYSVGMRGVPTPLKPWRRWLVTTPPNVGNSGPADTTISQHFTA